MWSIPSYIIVKIVQWKNRCTHHFGSASRHKSLMHCVKIKLQSVEHHQDVPMENWSIWREGKSLVVTLTDLTKHISIFLWCAKRHIITKCIPNDDDKNRIMFHGVHVHNFPIQILFWKIIVVHHFLWSL